MDSFIDNIHPGYINVEMGVEGMASFRADKIASFEIERDSRGYGYVLKVYLVNGRSYVMGRNAEFFALKKKMGKLKEYSFLR